jgi:hypothetical protein
LEQTSSLNLKASSNAASLPLLEQTAVATSSLVAPAEQTPVAVPLE